MDYLEDNASLFDTIVMDMKEKYLSKSHYPKLVLGTGLSLCFGLPGMKLLSEKLNAEFSADTTFCDLWDSIKADVACNGLEAGLATINYSDTHSSFVNKIIEITARFILEKEAELSQNIFKSDSSLKKILSYLADSCSNNNPILDIFTPNYDRIIEILCDSLNISVVTGFLGNTYQHFNIDTLSNPFSIFSKKNFIVRLFKPHGSLNWIEENSKVYCINDYKTLFEKIDKIQIVTPGSSKYEFALTTDVIRKIRERFNNILESDSSCSLVFFGYGFNDEHFNTVFLDKAKCSNILIISKDVKEEIQGLALSNDNITIIFKDSDDNNQIIYQNKKYQTREAFWNLDEFCNLFLA